MKPVIQKFSLVTVILLFSGITIHAQNEARNSHPSKGSHSDTALFVSLVNQYARTIDDGDTVLASKLWAMTPEISFINPRGKEYGWTGIKNIIEMFRDNFSARKLNCFNIKVADYGDFAWLEFYWVFDATLNFADNPIQTKGRETQIWRKMNNEWRLVHVHYSGMPATGEGQGF